ncbi:hypothetical protein QUF70_13165 [Desulfobacterales bacterium HSG17]|nr:hypothetical protein [Desulfobacterales bacterium HSG17]
MNIRSTVFEYLLSQYYNNDPKEMSEDTGYTVLQIKKWVKGDIIPNHQTLDYIFSCLYTPEFRVITEFFELDYTEPIKPQFRELFMGHEECSGIYAFYDSMANLLYVGKASNLFQESYDAILREVEIIFPAGVKNKNRKRYEVIKYISAYEIMKFELFDYPKHVESIILRISKPQLNKVIGSLEEAYPKEI